MTKEEIFSGLKEVISNVKPNTDLSSVSLSTLLVEELAIDSLSMLMLSLASEQKFSIEFDEHVRFSTVGDVVEYIAKAQN